MHIFIGFSLILLDLVILVRLYDLLPVKPIAKLRIRAWMVIFALGTGMDEYVEDLLGNIDRKTLSALEEMAFGHNGEPTEYKILFDLADAQLSAKDNAP